MREGTARAPLAGKRSRVLEAWCTDGVAEVTHGLLHSCAGSRMINLNQKLKKLDHFLVLSFQVSQLWQLAEGPSPSFVVLKVPVFQFQSECFDFGFTHGHKLSNRVCRCSRRAAAPCKMPACCCCCCHPVDGDGTAECVCAFVSTRNACACKPCHPKSIAFTLIQKMTMRFPRDTLGTASAKGYNFLFSQFHSRPQLPSSMFFP